MEYYIVEIPESIEIVANLKLLYGFLH